MIPVLASREEVGAGQRVPEESRCGLVLDVLVGELRAGLYLDVVEDGEVDLGVEVVASVLILRSHAL